MKKKLMILSLIMLGLSGQAQAMSALKQGMQNVARVCGQRAQQLKQNAFTAGRAVDQWVGKNPIKFVIGFWPSAFIVGCTAICAIDYYKSPKLTFKARSEIRNLYKQHMDGDIYIFNDFLMNATGVVDLRLIKVLAIGSNEVIQANAFFRETGDYSDISIKNCFYKAAYVARNFINPEHYPLSDKGHVKGILLHEIGHVFYEHHKKLSSTHEGLSRELEASNEKRLSTEIREQYESLYFKIMSDVSIPIEREADAFAAQQLTKNRDVYSLRAMQSLFNGLPQEAVRHSAYQSHPSHSERAAFFAQKADELEKQLAEEVSKI